jgi:RimJ/RimL family protein N-acetyltransferase
LAIENIIGAHIRLRPMSEADLPLKVKWYNDPDIRKTLIVDEQFELDKTIEWFEAIKDSKSRLDLTIEVNDGKPIGLIGLVNIDRPHKTAEIVIVIGDKDYWGKGVMLEAESLLIEYAFSQMRLEKIWAQARTNNIASMITMKKLGFQVEGTLRQHVCLDGKREDIFQVGLLKEEFKPVH